MSALNFKAEFVAPILAGTKFLTMRKPRVDGRDPAPLGGALDLYTGMRTKSCRRILTTETVYRCGLQFAQSGPVAVEGARHMHRIRPVGALIALATDRVETSLDALARADGFTDWASLWTFHSAEGPLDEIGCVYREVIGWEPPMQVAQR